MARQPDHRFQAGVHAVDDLALSNLHRLPVIRHKRGRIVGKASVHRIGKEAPPKPALTVLEEQAEDEREAKELRARLVQQATDKLEFYVSYLLGIGESATLEAFLGRTAVKIVNIRKIHGNEGDQ